MLDSNTEGKRKADFSFGNPFDRHKWTGTQLSDLKSDPLIYELWSFLLSIYQEHAAPFMRDKGVPEEVSPPPPPPCHPK